MRYAGQNVGYRGACFMFSVRALNTLRNNGVHDTERRRYRLSTYSFVTIRDAHKLYQPRHNTEGTPHTFGALRTTDNEIKKMLKRRFSDREKKVAASTIQQKQQPRQPQQPAATPTAAAAAATTTTTTTATSSAAMAATTTAANHTSSLRHLLVKRGNAA